MKTRPFFPLVAAFATMALTASCQCSGGQQQSGGTGESATQTTGPAALAERSFRLPNGLQADLVDGACGDSAALVVLVNVGIDHDPPGRSGMAHLAERVLATSVGAKKAERTVETGNDYTLYSVAVPGDRILEELDDVAAWMSQAAPTEADLARERALLVEELGRLSGADAPGTALRFAEEAVQPTAGNGRRKGIASEVGAITLAELQAFWQAHFKPGNARVVVAGRFDAEKVRARIEAAFTPLAAGTPPVKREAAVTTVKGTLVMGDRASAVAVAVPAPAMSDPLFGPFLVLAARLMEKTSPPATWQSRYDPLRRPELLFVTGPVGDAEQPEPAAGRMRSEVAAILARPLTPGDVTRAKETFQLLLEPQLVDPALCSKDARAFAIARARRAQLGIDAGPLQAGVEATTKEQLDDAAKLFDTKRTAAVIAGGAIR